MVATSETIRRSPTASVLIVDDEPDNCANMHDILTSMGYRADVAHGGNDALQLVAANDYDVALLDLHMPEMDGVELFRRIKQVRSETIAIIVTAYASSAAAREALDAGARVILSKPVDLGELLRLLG